MKLYIVQLAFVAFCFIAKIKSYETDLPEDYFVEAAAFLDSHFATNNNNNDNKDHNEIKFAINQLTAPSVEPTAAPTSIDNGVPTEEPTAEPSAEPSAAPTLAFSSQTSLDFSLSAKSLEFSLSGDFTSLPVVSLPVSSSAGSDGFSFDFPSLSADFSLTGDFESLPAVSLPVSTSAGSDGFSFDFPSLSVEFSLTGDFESFPTVPIPQPVSLPLSVSAGSDGFSFDFPSVSVEFSLTVDFESLPVLAPVSIPVPMPFPMPVPMPIPFPMPVPMPIPMPVPMPIPMPVPMPIPMPLPMPVPMPLPMPIPMPVPMPLPMPVPMPLPMPVPMPIPMPVPMPLPMPVPMPIPMPLPMPIPMPVPMPLPMPVPMPLPMPVPMPIPMPVPMPLPMPVPMPIPMPLPMPVPMPIPMPVPMPIPMPLPMPVPMPVPMPIPMPVPMPVPMPLPVPAPGTPTADPTLSPSIKPTNKPTVAPTSARPSRAPTLSPSNNPTRSPSAAPTPSAPTPVPTSAAPTRAPTVKPGSPTVAPTATASPTFRPTAQPSTAAPTFDPSAPVITTITATATRTTIVLDVLFPTSPLAGRVYCAAFADGTSSSVITSDRVVTSGTSTVYQPGASAVDVTLTDLKSVVDYDVYCTVVTVNGVASLTNAVVATKKDVTTACCKLLTYTNAPSFVQGYLASYTSSSPTSLYVFTYTLSSAPAASVTITPTVFDSTGSASSALAVLPASTVFASTATSLTGSFVLSGSDILSGTFSVSLVPSGTSVAQFGTTTTTTVKVVNATSPTPVPSVTKAQFASSGATIDVTFSAATNKGGFTTASFPCYQLLTFTGSDSTTCSWVSTSVVRIKFLATVYGTNLVTVGDSITLLSGLVKALCTSSNGCPSYVTADSQSVAVLLPDSPVVPTVVLQVPSVISGCDDVKLNPLLTTGSGGRSWAAVSWTVSVNTGASTASILSALNSYGPVTNNIISLSKANFPSAQYTITLTTTNFFGKSSSATAIFTIDGNPNLPIVSILGPSVLTVVPNDALTLFTTTARSSCFESASTVSYSWKVYNDGVEQTSIQSLSTSPTKFALSPYTLAIESVYTVEFIATASATANYDSITTSSKVTVQVSKGAIVAVVLGGSFRSIATTSTDASGTVSLDASQSYDQSYPSGTSTEPMSFSWSCLYVSGANYGSSCDDTNLPAVTNSSVLAVPTASLSYMELFQFTVTVSTADGRSSSYAVTVQNKAGTTSTTINNLVLTKVNPQKRLVLVGAVKSSTPVDASWTAFIDGVAQTFTASSPLSSTFTAAQVASFLSYPLSVPSNTFTAGSTVTFRLLAHLAGNASASSSYSEVVIAMNAPPSGGTVAIDPTSGAALSQNFVITAATWTDDPSDYPLSYEFTYTRASGQPPLTVQSKTTASAVSTTLPAGLASQSNQLTVKCTVYDNFLATASATTPVTVTASASVDVSIYLDEQIAASDAAGNTDAITQAIANAASTVNEVNCTLASASFCANLNREVCYLTPQTCSECLDGYTGLAGDRNSKCRDPTNDNTVLGGEGDACSTDDDCELSQCTDSVCTVPVKECYTVNTQECSGSGQCTYLTTSGAPYGRTCLITDTDCVAKCDCEQGFGGKGCALSDAELVSRDSTRAELCRAVITVSESDDVSFFLLDTLISALYSCYDPDEVVSADAQEVCFSALTVLSDYSAQGFLSEDSSDLIVAVAAKFAVSTANENTESQRRRLDTTENRASVVDQSITGIVSGVLFNMADGQDPVQIVNDEIQLIVVKSLASDLTSLSAPLTDEQIEFGITAANTIEISESEGFENSDGYIEAAVLNWGVNPFPNSQDVENSLMRIEVRANMIDERRRRAQESLRNGSDPDFFVTLQFNEVQDFNFTLTLDQALVLQPVNYTFPECNYFNGANYSRCDGCWVSTYTNYNVTYGCTRSFIRDVPALRRRLQEETESQVVNMGAIVANIELSDVTEYVYDVSDNAVLAFMTILSVCVVVGLYAFWVWDLYDAKAAALGAAAARANKNELEVDFSSIHGEDTLQYDAFFESAAVSKPDAMVLTSSSAVANFLDSVLPDECRQDGADSWLIFLGALLQNHDYIKVFHNSPQPYTHSLRFVRITLSFLLNLFFTTIFFGSFYPNGGTCERYEAQDECLSKENQVTDSTLCKWEVDSSITSGGYCVLNPPPRTFVFVITVMICVVLVSAAVLFVYDLLLQGICALRPSLEPTPKRTALPATAAMTNPAITHDVYMSAKYEANQMLLSVKDYLDSSHNLNSSADEARLEAVQKYVGIFPTGELAPLDMTDRVLYGTTQQRLVAHVSAARSSSKQIQGSLSMFTDAEKQEQEIFLMRSFVLEQFTPLKRYLLSSHLQAVVPGIPESANPILWGLTWTFVLLSIAFLLFWGFWWGARQQGDTSAAWGMVLGTALAQEVLVVQVFRCFAVSFLGLRCLYPQLQAVYRAVNKAAVSAMQDETPTGTVRVCQHLSGACRAAHAPIAANLNSARVLRSVDDADVALCRLKHRTTLPVAVHVMTTLPAYASLLSQNVGSLLLQWLYPATLAGLLIMNFYFWKGARWFIFLPYGLLIVGYFWKYKVHLPSRHNLLVRKNSDNAYATANWNEAMRGSTSRGFFGRVYSRLTAASYFVTRPSKLSAEYSPRDPHTDRQWSSMNRPANVQAVVTLIAAPTDSLMGGVHGMGSCSSAAALTAMRASVPPEIAQLLCVVHEEVELAWANAAAEALRSGEMESEKAYFTNLMRADVERPLVPLADPTSPEERYSPTKQSQRAGTSTEMLTDPEEAVARVLHIYRQHISEGEMSLVDAEDFNALFTREADECDVLVEFFDLRIVLEEVLCFFQPAHHPLSAEEKDEIVSSLYNWLAKNADALLDEHYQHDTNRIAAATLARIQRSLPSDATTAEAAAAQDTNFSVPFHQFRSWFLSTSMTVSTYRHAQQRLESSSNSMQL